MLAALGPFPAGTWCGAAGAFAVLPGLLLTATRCALLAWLPADGLFECDGPGPFAALLDAGGRAVLAPALLDALGRLPPALLDAVGPRWTWAWAFEGPGCRAVDGPAGREALLGR